jgi:hypothetical protein
MEAQLNKLTYNLQAIPIINHALKKSSIIITTLLYNETAIIGNRLGNINQEIKIKPQKTQSQDLQRNQN